MSSSEDDDVSAAFPFRSESFDALVRPLEEVVSSIDRVVNFLLDNRRRSLRERAFALLKRTVTTAEDPAERLALLFRHLLPLLLMTDANFKTPGASPAANARENRDAAVGLLGEFKGVGVSGDGGAGGFKAVALAMAQRVAFLSVDKAEWRRATVETTMALSEICPEMNAEFSEFIFRLMTAERPNQRLVALEILASWAVEGRFGVISMVVHAISGRCVDTAATVRAAAVQRLAEVAAASGDRKFLQEISEVIAARLLDEKANVRKAALTAVDVVLERAEEISDVPEISAVARLAFDESLMTRKTSITTIGNFFQKFPTLQVATVWTQAVLPLISDPEISVAEKALEVAEFFFVKNFRSSRVMLEAVASHYETSEFLQRALRRLLRGNPARTKSLTEGLLSEISKNFRQPALWVMLEEISDSLASSNALTTRVGETALAAWRKFSAEKISDPFVSRVLRILALTKPGEWRAESPEVRDLIGNLHKFPISMISAAVRAAAAADATETRRLARAMVDRLDQRLRLSAGERGEEACERLLAVVGEMLLCFGDFGAEDSFFTAVRAVAETRAETPRMRAAAYRVWGCGCLAKETLAKRSIATLLSELVAVDQPVEVRQVLVVVIGDLCAAGHANERLVLPSLSLSLSDSRTGDACTRQQALMTLASLLAEDFVKFRGNLIFRFLFVASEEDEPEVQNLAKAVFVRIILPRSGVAIFKTHFLDILRSATGKDKDFSLMNNPKRRRDIYRFVIAHLDNPAKCDVLFALTEQLFGHFLDDERNGRSAAKLPLAQTDPTFLLFTDALAILSSPAMRVSASPASAAADAAAAAAAATSEAVEEAEGKLMGNFWAKFLASQILPTVLELKSLMERERSPLLRYMEKALLLLIADFRDQLAEFLVDQHAQLLAEIDFDLEELQRHGCGRKQQATVANFELFPLGTAAGAGADEEGPATELRE